ncbi:flagella synthesis protein FlgN [Thalassomonas actiniarum]|uniref:Flagellar protein FlgN n=1 Tax=Thalassomonas actiniarum TaxID=485447 RepID=A0AAF0C4X5_9GAMM|nr:flagellar protein FlgN [Thalassomonas actiniarum]WDE00464.1 flagellar protein FlgN [Thalassomonas actiniarum]
MSVDNTPEQLLARQLSQLQALETLLQSEKDIIIKQSPDALNEVTAKKNDLLMAIQTLDSHIGQNRQFIQDKRDGKFSEELKTIASVLESCQKQNQLNGQIIQQSQLTVERMKTSLLESHSKTSLTYDSKGKKSGGLSSLGLKA